MVAIPPISTYPMVIWGMVYYCLTHIDPVYSIFELSKSFMAPGGAPDFIGDVGVQPRRVGITTSPVY